MTPMEERRKKVEEIRCLFPDHKWPEPVTEPLWWGRRKEHSVRVEGKKVLVDGNSDPDQPVVYGIISDQYGLYYHEEMLHSILHMVEGLPEFGKPCVKPVILDEGAKMKVEVIFEEQKYEVRVGDYVNPRITALNSYDLTWKARGDFGAYRLICSNGAKIGKRWAAIAGRHILSLDFGKLLDKIRRGMERFSVEVGMWQKWAERRLTADEYRTLWYTLPFSEREVERIEAEPELGTKLLLPDALQRNALTLWDFNAVTTQFVTHAIKTETRRNDLENTVANTLNNLYYDRLEILSAEEIEKRKKGSEDDNGNNGE